jgi:hypothetical protein
MSSFGFRMLPKVEQQLYIGEVMGKINRLMGKNKKGKPMIDYAKNGICGGLK